jgi:cob(I)alamin adenosyltransferase
LSHKRQYTFVTLYTKKGDTGTTKVFSSKPGERISKGSCQTEALGALDELNSFLGLVKVKDKVTWSIDYKQPADIIFWVQNCLFTIQAEVAGAEKHITADKVMKLEMLTDIMERDMPPINTFFISGGTELASLLDIARTLTRRAEREVVRAVESKEAKVVPETLAYLNRLSSLLYAMARLTNHKSGIKEEPPTYK